MTNMDKLYASVAANGPVCVLIMNPLVWMACALTPKP